MYKFLDKLLGLLPWNGEKTVIGTIIFLITHYAVVLWPTIPWAEIIVILEYIAGAYGGLGLLHWRVKAKLGK
jgi:hypothetical protein